MCPHIPKKKTSFRCHLPGGKQRSCNPLFFVSLPPPQYRTHKIKKIKVTHQSFDMNQLQQTTDRETPRFPPMPSRLWKGKGFLERHTSRGTCYSNISEDISLRYELERLNEDDVPACVDAIEISSGSSDSSQSLSVRSDNRGELGFIKCDSLMEVANRMQDLDTTFADFHRNALTENQNEKNDIVRSDLSIDLSFESDDIEFDELRWELEMVDGFTSSSCIRLSPHASSSSLGQTYTDTVEVKHSEVPSRLELLKARHKLLRSRSYKKLVESRKFVQCCQDSRRMVFDEPDQASSAFLSKNDIPKYIEFNPCLQEDYSLDLLSTSEDETTYYEEEDETVETIQQLISHVKHEQDILQKHVDTTRKESRKSRRLRWGLMALFLCVMCWHLNHFKPTPIFHNRESSLTMSNEQMKPITQIRKRLAVTTGRPLKVKSLKMERFINPTKVIRISSNYNSCNSTIDSPSIENEEEKGLNMITQPSRVKLIRGAFHRRSSHQIHRASKTVKSVVRKLLGSSEAGGVLDFKHNNVGVWARVNTI